MKFSDAIKDSVLNGFNTDISTVDIVVVLGITLLLGLYIFFVYRAKTRSTFYSRDFNNVLAMLPIVTAGIVLAMQSSIVISLGMVGALSIVRFRNAVKSSLDLLFLFWSISVGIVCGAGIFDIALIMSLIITIVMYALDLLPNRKSSLLLVINANDPMVEEELLPILKKYSSYQVKSRNINKNGVDMIVELRTKEEKKILEECSKLNGILNINLLSHDGERKF